MNRLQLAERLRQKAGIAGTISTTIGQTGEFAHVVNWIDEAYEYIQNEFETWSFLRQDFSFDTVSGTSEYSAATIASDLAQWQQDTFRVYLKATGLSDEQWLTFVPWRWFRDAYMYASTRTDTGRPTNHTIIREDPQDGIRLYPVPDDIYTVTGEYYQTPDVMTADADEPIIPVRYQMAIVWKGLELYGSYNEEPNREAKGAEEYDKLKILLCTNMLPKIHLGKPLA